MSLYDDIINAQKAEHVRHTEVHKYVTDLYCIKQAELRRKYGSKFKGNHFTLMGNLVHKGVQETVEGYKSEIPVVVGDLHGRADLVKDDTLYEIKYSPFGNSKNNELYLLQASMYAHNLGLSNVEILILSGTKSYTFNICDNAVDNYYKRATAIFANEEYPVMDVKCKYCEYKGVHCLR